MLSLYNTATRKKEEFKPFEEGKVSMYTCGPTVYHFAHIGNLRTYIMEDILDKYLRYIGYDVKRIMNITDVGHLSSDADTGEDKMLKGAKREHKSVMEIAKFYTDAFFADCEKLNIKRPEVVEPATSCIDEFIKMIEVLIEKGYAYEAGGNIYFDTSKLDEYYVFNKYDAEDLAFVMAFLKILTNAIKQTLFFGLQNQNLMIKSLNGTALGVSVTLAGILSVRQFQLKIQANTLIFIAAVLITLSHTILTKLHSQKLILDINGVIIGSMFCILTLIRAKCQNQKASF